MDILLIFRSSTCIRLTKPNQTVSIEPVLEQGLTHPKPLQHHRAPRIRAASYCTPPVECVVAASICRTRWRSRSPRPAPRRASHP